MVVALYIKANGPAIKLVSVTRRRLANVLKTVLKTVVLMARQGGYGMRFCSPGTN